jgi:serine/threonine protein kinase
MAKTAHEEYVQALLKRGFVLKERIGGGAYGTVYKAEQTSLRRAVAVKFFDNPFTRDDANRKRFEREGPLLARVQHPSIPYVILTGTVLRQLDGIAVPYTVMQYISGPPLDRRLVRGAIELPLVYRIMRDVLSALECAHQQGVIHRDVKPDNIILSDFGNYLLDFSIGICVTHEPGLTRATNTGAQVGTTNYAAPEQLVDASAVDSRADIYSAGVVLAEMLGARPRLKLENIDTEIAHAPSALRKIVRTAAAELPTGRYQRASDFLLALEGVIGPSIAEVLDAQIVLCPNSRCSGGKWSNGSGNYYWGPKVGTPTTLRFCEHCGTEYLRGCPKCQRPLPANIANLVVKGAKSERDALEAHCAQCGGLIFQTPTCAKCRSYLTDKDIGTDTSESGCAKCRRRAPVTTYGRATKYASDDDIPF